MNDEIYKYKKVIEDFKFDNNVTKVFNDMVVRSVPFYKEVQELILKFIESIIQDNSIVYDLGCSTGNMIFLLLDKLKKKNVKMIGIDSSQSMIEFAKQKVNPKLKYDLEFINKDILSYKNYEKADVFILNLVLQFIRPIYRKELLQNIYNSLKNNGYLILFEKILDDNSFFSRKYIEIYYDFKKNNGYSELEISKKREELENVLIPYTVEENIELLNLVGFNNISVLFKVINFAVIIAKK